MNCLLFTNRSARWNHKGFFDGVSLKQQWKVKRLLLLLILSVCFKQVDVQDPRFQAMFTSHLYNLDPSDPAFKKTKATQSILEEKQRRREQKQQQNDQTEALKSQQRPGEPSRSSPEPENTSSGGDSTSKKVMDPSLSSLIKSVKSKTEQFQARKKQRIK